ncbi:unnamed protein product [Brassica oleracea var. botrytis]
MKHLKNSPESYHDILYKPLNPRPLSDFTVHATLSSPPFQSLSCGSRHEESIRRVLIASFDLRFNNPKCLQLQIHRPFLNPSTTIYHSIRVSFRQGGVINRASDGGMPPLYVAVLERHIETDSAVTLDLGAFVAQITATIDHRGYSSKGGGCLPF